MSTPASSAPAAEKQIVGWRVVGRRTMRGWKSPVVRTRPEAYAISRAFWAGLTSIVPVFEGEA